MRFKLRNSNPNRRPAVTAPGVRYAREGFAHALSGTVLHHAQGRHVIEACRPKGKTAPKELRRTISAIVWRHQNGAKWRAIPAELGPWSRAAQTFIRWARLGVWERQLLLAQERGVQLGRTFLDGTSIRAHHKAAGAEKRGPTARGEMSVKRWAAREVGMGPKRV